VSTSHSIQIGEGGLVFLAVCRRL